LEIWDTAGSERYRSIIPIYYRNTHVVVIVYDITSRQSFDNIEYWHEQISKTEPNCIKIIIGNKKDLDFDRKVSTREAQHLASNMNCLFFEVSCMTNENISLFLDTLVDVIIKKKLQSII